MYYLLAILIIFIIFISFNKKRTCRCDNCKHKMIIVNVDENLNLIYKCPECGLYTVINYDDLDEYED